MIGGFSLIKKVLSRLFLKKCNNDYIDLEEARHIIINKALCIQGCCLKCCGEKNSPIYMEIKDMCNQITDAARRFKI